MLLSDSAFRHGLLLPAAERCTCDAMERLRVRRRCDAIERLRMRCRHDAIETPHPDTVYLQANHCCYRSRVVCVEIQVYSETVTSFTDFLMEDVLEKKGVHLQRFGLLLYALGCSFKAPSCTCTLPTFLSLCTLRTSRFCLLYEHAPGRMGV